MTSHLRLLPIALSLTVIATGCRINNAIAPEAHATNRSGTSSTPALVSPAVTSTGGVIAGSGNGQNAPGTSMPSGPGLKGGPLDKENAAEVK